jgi:hypothetical protein
VPIDLDEILPASSKQKKLVLPSLHRTTSSGSLRRASRDSRGGASASAATSVVDSGAEQQQQQGGNPTKSGAGGTSKSGKKAAEGSRRAAADPQRTFDLVSARQLCMLTDAALRGMTEEELQGHVKRLGTMQGTAQDVLAYWQKRTDEKIGDREAFEGVIENLVKHARKVRK